MIVPVLLALWIAAPSTPARAASNCADTTHLWSTNQDSVFLWPNRDSTDVHGPSYVGHKHEIFLAKECAKGWMRVVAKNGSMHWAPQASLVHFEPKTMASIDLSSGTVNGFLDSPQSVSNLIDGDPSIGEISFDRPLLEGAPASAPLARKAESSKLSKAPRGVASEPRSEQKLSGLRVGVSDDNQQFSAFTEFLKGTGSGLPHCQTNVEERIKIRFVDSKDRGVSDLDLKFATRQGLVEEGKSLANGTYWLFPKHWNDSVQVVQLTILGSSQTQTIDRAGPREIEVRVPDLLRATKEMPVDIVFVIDATSSMSNEIDRLKKALSILEMNLTSMPGKPKLRFGLVEYRDSGDDFRVRKAPLSSDVDGFTKRLEKVEAGGGGDTPEDLQSALDTTVRGMNWTKHGIRLAFVITDAPPHLDYGQKFTYADAAHLARQLGIKIHTLGAGGLDLQGEVVMRQVAQVTGGKYVFLTYGERGESAGGHEASVSHHTGDNWVSEKLETVLLRLARDEISQIAEVPPVDSSGWFEATKSGSQSQGAILSELFRQAVDELVDYSSIALADSSAVAILATVPEFDSLGAPAKILEQNLSLAISRSKRFRVVDRGNLGMVLRELALQKSGAVEESKVVETGKILGANFLIASGLVKNGPRYELFLKLLRVETGEVLSATRAKIDRSLLEN